MKFNITIPSSTRFCQKGNSRIFVKDEVDAGKVIKLMWDIDADEMENYYPEGLVTSSSTVLIYNAKFDIDVEELLRLCYLNDLDILVYSCNEYDYEEALTLEVAVERQLCK